MNIFNNKKVLLWAALAAIALPSVATMSRGGASDKDNVYVDSTADSRLYREYLPGTLPLEVVEQIQEILREDSTYREQGLSVDIKVLARTYGDSIVLRWGLSEYPEWNYLNKTGVSILRICLSGEGYSRIDTLTTGLKPLSLDDFKARYPDQTDSLAYIAMGSLYGSGELTMEQTKYEPGSLGALTEIQQDQKWRLMASMLAGEWRPDLAAAMGMRYVDRTAKRGETYTYFVAPTIEDTTKMFLINSGIVEYLINEKYKPKPYDIALEYEVTGHGEASLMWNDTINGSFEIYRRAVGTSQWVKETETPYVPPFAMDMTNEGCNYPTAVQTLGEYEYCVAAHDAFGDLTPKSKPVRIRFPDMRPPNGPDITLINIDRPGETPTEKIYADIYFRKDILEEDFVRYVPMYYNQRDSSKTWRLLTDQYIAPTDTMVRVDVTKLTTGMVTIAAVDTAENMGYSIPRMLYIGDMKPPMPPTNVRALPELDGTVLLTWDMPDSLDVHYYDVLFSNGLDHDFMLANKGHIFNRSFMDTIATDANERYIYYYVRAIDYAYNIGESSDTIRVLRPNPTRPSVAHLDTAWTDNKTIHMRWVGDGDEMIKSYNVYRRLQGQKKWTLLRTFDGDSVKADNYFMDIEDSPTPNRRQRYEYAIEALSFWDISSGMSLVYSVLLSGDLNVDATIKLLGNYDAKAGEARIAWEVTGIPEGMPYYYCIYRCEPGAKQFRFLTDVDSDQRFFTDFAPTPGTVTRYYVSIRFEDGRQTPPSNTVTITVPEKVPATATSTATPTSNENP